KLGFTLRVPCGVVVAITPFNFPLNLVCHKVGPALAAGNAVVLKPASDTPLSALRLVEILLEAGLPPLAISCLTGSGGTIGDALKPKVEAIVAGNQLDAKTQMGPMVREADALRVGQWIDEAVSGGARVVVGGQRRGAVFQATLVADVAPSMRISCDELFGPAV